MVGARGRCEGGLGGAGSVFGLRNARLTDCGLVHRAPTAPPHSRAWLVQQAHSLLIPHPSSQLSPSHKATSLDVDLLNDCGLAPRDRPFPSCAWFIPGPCNKAHSLDVDLLVDGRLALGGEGAAEHKGALGAAAAATTPALSLGRGCQHRRHLWMGAVRGAGSHSAACGNPIRQGPGQAASRTPPSTALEALALPAAAPQLTNPPAGQPIPPTTPVTHP